jgi:acyl-CoA thioesterase-1
VKRVAALCVLAGAAALTVACASRSRSESPLPEAHGAAILYVALGDSTVEGVGASSPEATYVGRLHAKVRGIYPNARVLNLGVGGATSDDVVRRQLARAVAARPDLVTLSIGPNDIEAGMRVERYEYNIAHILTRLTRETHAVVVVSLVPDMTVTPRFRASPQRDAVARAVPAFNEALRNQIRVARVDAVDIYTASQIEVPRRPELVGADGYHPSDLGYARWAELMWQVVQPRIDGARRRSDVPWMM